MAHFCGNINVHCYLPESKIILKYVSASMIQFMIIKKLNFFIAFHFLSSSYSTDFVYI
jgi:hypothetical protein